MHLLEKGEKEREEEWRGKEQSEGEGRGGRGNFSEMLEHLIGGEAWRDLGQQLSLL